jgi:hypothetical protein
MAMAAKQFDPNVYEACVLFGETYVMQPHPAAPSRRYAQMGGRGRVFQLQNQGDSRLWALKVFHKRYQVPGLVTTAGHLSLVEGFEGMHAAKRRIILPSDPIVGVYSNLEYAMMMPWIRGKTWYDLLVKASKGGSPLPLKTSLRLCRRFLKVVAGLEECGMAHTDLSPGNVVFELGSCDVQLLDLEDIYMPAALGAKVARGSKGYRHMSGDASGENFWRPEGDRYAAAVLAAEIIVLSNRDLARLATDEGFFTDHRDNAHASTRFGEAKALLSKVAPTFAAIFERAWLAETIGECPRVSELYEAAREDVSNAPMAYQFEEGVKAEDVPNDSGFARWYPPSPSTPLAPPPVWRPIPVPPPVSVPQRQPISLPASPPVSSPAPPPAPAPAQTYVPPSTPVVQPFYRRDATLNVAIVVGIGALILALLAVLILLLLSSS